MTQSITADPQFTTTAPVRPVPGEKIGMETGPAPLATLFQTLVDRDNYLWAVVNALLPYCGEIEITSSNLILPPLAVSLLASGAWKVYSTGGATVSLAALSAVSNAWRYAYLYVSGGALAVEFSADAPDATRTWKSTGVSTHRYLAPIRMGAVAGQAVPLRGRNGRWSYVTPMQAYSSNATVNGAASLAALVPPHGRRAFVMAKAAPGVGGDVIVEVGPIGNPAAIVRSADTARMAGAEVVLSAAQEVNANITVTTAGTGEVWVGTFSE